jgi:transposase-like protein
MKRKQFTEEQIIGILKEAEAGAVVTELCRKHGMSSATYYAWKAKFGGLEVSDAKRLRSLEEENGRLKRLLADTMLDNAGLKDLLSKNGSARREAASGRASPGDVGDERAAGVCCRRGGSYEHAVSLVPSG